MSGTTWSSLEKYEQDTNAGDGFALLRRLQTLGALGCERRPSKISFSRKRWVFAKAPAWSRRLVNIAELLPGLSGVERDQNQTEGISIVRQLVVQMRQTIELSGAMSASVQRIDWE
jgi:hypothetical protein